MLKKVFGWISYIHEIWHYLPARLFGANAHMEPYTTYFDGKLDDWQVLVITLGPVIVGVIGAGVTILNWPVGIFGQLKWGVFWVGWFFVSGADIRKAIRLLKGVRNER